MLRRRSRLRIAVPEGVLAHNPRGGHGRVWHSVLAELRRIARVDVGGSARSDAWLIDGHHEPVRTDLPVVAQVHETSWEIPEVRDSLDPRFIDLLETRTRAAVACASRIVTASAATRAQIAAWAGWDPRRIDVVPHGVDVAVFRPGLRPPVAGPYVLFAATVHPRKNLAALREAMSRLSEFPHRLVVVAGPAPDRDDSAALEAEAFSPLRTGAPVVRVQRPGDAELAALMAGCDAFVLPSLWEGFGLTALEAMACGAPVVVADRGPLPEVVGSAGVAVDPTADGIEGALRALLGDASRRDALRAAARSRALGMTWAHTARGWLASVENARA